MEGQLLKLEKTDMLQSSTSSTEQDENVLHCIALFDYEARDDDELSFTKGEQLAILNRDEEWWLGKSLASKLQGYVPSNFIAPIDTVHTKDWYFGKTRKRVAETLLMAPGLKRGTFLVGESSGNIVLSVRDHIHGVEEFVRHYHIFKEETEDGLVYYIHKNSPFHRIQDLVYHHQKEADGLFCVLTTPCPKRRPKTQTLGRDKWEIRKESLTLGEKLGSGNFGEVWKGLWLGKTEVAIKTFKPDAMSSADFRAEAHILKSCQHDNLVQLYAVCKDPIYIVTELMELGDLRAFLLEGAGKHFDILQLVDVATQVSNGMMYLESKNYIHRDLAARNVLVGRNHVYKVADFGLARIIKDEEYTSQKSVFPIRWTAPESLNHRTFTIKSDVWSFGILMYEIFTHGGFPYPDIPKGELYERLAKGYRLQKMENCPDSIYETCMQKCWHEEPHERPSFKFLHTFLDEFYMQKEETNEESEEKSVPEDNSKSTIVVEEHGQKIVGDKHVEETDVEGTQEGNKEEEEAVKLIHSYASTIHASKVKDESRRSKSDPVYIALFDYRAQGTDDISLKKGEKVQIVNTENENWWLAYSSDSCQEGYIPSNYIAPEDSLLAEDWYFGALSHERAEKMLLGAGLAKGTFLVRDNELNPGDFDLVIRDSDTTTGWRIKHVRIQKHADTSGYFITGDRTYQTLNALIMYYKEFAIDLQCCRLTEPYSKNAPTTKGLGKDIWDISRDSITLGQELGTGQFSTTWIGFWNTNTRVAIKVLKPQVIPPYTIRSEAKLRKHHRHENLIQLYALSSEAEPIYIVTEIMPHGDLLTFLRDGEGTNLQLQELLSLGAQIANGMAYLEDNNLVLRNLTAKKVLMGANHECKISDCGLSILITANNCPIKWTSPEAVLEGKFTIKSDVWSFGIVLTEIVSKGCPPYPDMNDDEVVNRVKSGYVIPKDKEWDASLYSMCMLKCWRRDPLQRPSFGFLRAFLDDFFVSTEPDYYAPGEESRTGTDSESRAGALSSKSTFTQEDSSLNSSNIEDQLYIACNEYRASLTDELPFKKGEQLNIINKEQSDWWFAFSTTTEQRGYIPSSHVVPNGSMLAEEWYFGNIGLKEAEEKLLAPGRTKGQFLIRDSSDDQPGEYELLVRNQNILRKVSVKHYQIQKMAGYYQITDNQFPDVRDLVRYYKNNDGLLCRLTVPCPKEFPVSEVSHEEYVALHDYDNRSDDELPLKNGEKLRVRKQNMENDWLLAQSKLTSRLGYVPSNYIALVNFLAAEEWFFGKTGRSQIKAKLLSSGLPSGTFAVREGQTYPGEYSLQVLFQIPDQGSVVHNYRIRKKTDGADYYFINQNACFPTVQQLVHHYQESADGLYSKLITPCPKEAPITSGLGKHVWETPRELIKLETTSDTNQMVEVWKGLWNDKLKVGVRVYHSKNTCCADIDFMKDIADLKILRHENIVHVFAVCSTQVPIYVITEPMLQGCLKEHLKTDSGKNLSIKEVIEMGAQIAKAMAYLECKGYVHRYLTAKSVLVGRGNLCKVTDLGMQHMGCKLSMKWTAPEAALYQHFSVKSDVWSFGILLTELVTFGCEPYSEMTASESILKVEQGYRMSRMPDCPNALYEWMLKSWNKDPEKRPTFEFLHYFLEDFSVSAEPTFQEISCYE